MIKKNFLTLNHKNKNIVNDARGIIKNFFGKSEDYYRDLDFENFRLICARAQDKLNEENFTLKIFNQLKEKIFLILNTEKILIQSNLYLRASRTSNLNPYDYIDFHRESFYGSGLIKCKNIWTPIKGVNDKNTLNYIPKSHFVKNKDIKISKKKSEIIKRFSNGHKTGLLYKSAKIKNSKFINLNLKKKMMVPYFSSSMFEGQLIHGAAKNTSKFTRFSLDFRIIKKSDYNSKFFMKKKFASKKTYFIEL